MAEQGGKLLLSIIIWLILLITEVVTEEVCYTQDSSLYFCENGYNCCDGDEKCCVEMNTWAIVGIACGSVAFVAIVIVLACFILKKTSKGQVQVVQAQHGMSHGPTHYGPQMGGPMMLPGQVMPHPPMYDPMMGGSSSYGYNPQFVMDNEFQQFGNMKKKEQFNKNEKKGGSLGPDMTPAPAPLRIGQVVATAPVGGMEPPPYRPPSDCLSPTPEPPDMTDELPEGAGDGADGDFEHPPPS